MLEYFIAIIIVLAIVIAVLLFFVINQINKAGMKVTDFISFINANKNLNRLYELSLKYKKLSYNEQITFAKEAKKIFDIFDKVPSQLWEDEYRKYMKILDKYKNIRMENWKSGYIEEFDKRVSLALKEDKEESKNKNIIKTQNSSSLDIEKGKNIYVKPKILKKTNPKEEFKN